MLERTLKSCVNFEQGEISFGRAWYDIKHVIAWENSKIITTNNPYRQRRCLEAWHINMNVHALKRDDGSCLPQECLHFGGK